MTELASLDRRDAPAPLDLSAAKAHAARAAVEEAARCAQAIGNCYLGTGSAAAVAAQVAEDVRGARSRAWLDAHKWTPRGYELRPGCADPAEQWTETPEQCGERAARGGS